MFNIVFFFFVLLSDSVEKYIQPGRPHNDISMRIVCWITKATDTHSECIMIASVSSANQYSWLGRLPVYRFFPHFGLIKLNIIICKLNNKRNYMEGGTKGTDVEMFSRMWNCIFTLLIAF
jgi:hypothetical protein